MMRGLVRLSCGLVAAVQIVILLGGAPGAGASQAIEGKAATSKKVVIGGLSGPATILRDERGVPQIQARSLDDAFAAQGYATAADRLWQMDLLRRTARGELSEIFGEATLGEDRRRRTYGWSGLAREMLEGSTAEERRMLEAFARGVNVYISSPPDGLPGEFGLLGYEPREWTPEDSLVIGKLFAESLSMSWETDLVRQALSDLPEERRRWLLPVESPLDVVLVGEQAARRPGQRSGGRPARAPISIATLERVAGERAAHQASLARIGLYAEDGRASNGWVISGERSASGKPVLANDPHLNPSMPSIWHAVSIAAEGMRIAGVTAPGVPGVLIGRNDRIAWGITSLGADAQDLYQETLDESGTRALGAKGWEPIERRREVIRVRRMPGAPEVQEVIHEVRVTKNGPIVLDDGSGRFSMRWTALSTAASEILAFRRISTARNWAEFRGALGRYAGPPQSFVYADVDGRIGFSVAGHVPVRRSGDGSVPYDGRSRDGDWLGLVPFDELPSLFDPPSGMIVVANQRVVGSSYRHHLTHEWAHPYRARRILDRLRAKEKHSIDDIVAIQSDTYSYPDAIFAREVLEMARPRAQQSRDWKALVALLDGWDATASADSRVLPIVVEMRRAFLRRIYDSALGPDRARLFWWANYGTSIDRAIQERPKAWLPGEYSSYEELVLACYAEARERLTKQLGEDESQWRWGRIGSIDFAHPLSRIPGVRSRYAIPPLEQHTGGSTRTVNAGEFVSMRFVADLSSWDRTRLGIAPGQSGDPSSPHWADQLADWYRCLPQPLVRHERASGELVELTKAGVPPASN